jgi:hypothetical protein
MIKEVIDIWFNKLKRPNERTKYAYYIIKNTNIILAKNFDGEFGLILTDTSEIPKNFKLKNFDFSYKDNIETTAGVFFKRCQRMFAHSNVNTDFLIKILFGVLEDAQKPYSSNTLMKVLKELKDLFDPEEQKKIEIIGVWGELFMINELIEHHTNKYIIESILNSWEGDGGRKKIDFRFIHAKIAIEVKTTTDEKRIHHFSGLEQFKVPLGFSNLYFASFRILNDDAGLTCFDITNKIVNKINDKSLIDLLDEKLIVRGRALCYDRYYRFTPRDEDKFSVYNSQKISLPSTPEGVLDIKWRQDFCVSKKLGITSVKQIYKKIKSR